MTSKLAAKIIEATNSGYDVIFTPRCLTDGLAVRLKFESFNSMYQFVSSSKATEDNIIRAIDEMKNNIEMKRKALNRIYVDEFEEVIPDGD